MKSLPLRRETIHALKAIQLARRLNIQQLKLSMNPAPFSWQTLQKALEGKPIKSGTVEFLVWWTQNEMDRVALPLFKLPATTLGENRE